MVIDTISIDKINRPRNQVYLVPLTEQWNYTFITARGNTWAGLITAMYKNFNVVLKEDNLSMDQIADLKGAKKGYSSLRGF